MRRASLRKNILQSWAPGQFHCELTFYDEHYLLNQYLYNHFESSVLIVANCSDYLHIELLLSYCVRVTVHYCVHVVSVISFLCVRAFIYHCVHIFTVLSCQISLCTRHCKFLCALNLQMRTQIFVLMLTLIDFQRVLLSWF